MDVVLLVRSGRCTYLLLDVVVAYEGDMRDMISCTSNQKYDTTYKEYHIYDKNQIYNQNHIYNKNHI